jgi:hydrogenase maturation protease
MRILIVGAGNLLLSDEGFGVHCLRYLERHYSFPEEVQLLDAGTLGLMIMHRLEESDVVYLIDTVTAAGEPGSWRRYTKSEFLFRPLPLKLSPHQAGIREMLLVSELRGCCPRDVVLFGVIPDLLAPGIQLTPKLERRVPELAGLVVAELGAHGMIVQSNPRGAD